ncbi:hypothetical protein ACFW04_014214 [Cataglyphis niger]
MHKISHRASIFSAEAWAIYNAILLILDINTSKVSIISDSMSAKLKAACIQKIRIQFIWVPSHRGICGNEIAELARRAIKEDMAINFKVPYSDLFSHWAKFKSILFFKRIYQKNKKPFYNMSLSKETIVTVSCIKSNHYNLNYSLFRKNLIDNKSCSCGHPSQDINHIVFCCPNTHNKSTQLRSAIVSAGH